MVSSDRYPRLTRHSWYSLKYAAMLLRYSFGLGKEADAVENAVKAVLKKGLRTIDIMDEGKTLLGTREMGDAIVNEIN